MSPPRGHDERSSVHWQRPSERSGHQRAESSENMSGERKNAQPQHSKDSVPVQRISVPAPPKGPEQVYLLILVRNCYIYSLVEVLMIATRTWLTQCFCFIIFLFHFSSFHL